MEAFLFYFDVAVFFVPEILNTFWKRSKSADQRADHGSLQLIVFGFVAGLFAAIWLHNHLQAAAMGPNDSPVIFVGTALVLLGVGFRRYAILVLGRFFTGDVAIRQGHEIVRKGPYRWLRHPSYTGAVIAVAGLGLGLNNWLSLGVLLAMSMGVYGYRMQVEEAALLGAFGEAYAQYQRETKRLLPFVY
jgi:protein-S-isoprenylcysteine O-methyltransferase Ste14